MVISAAAHPAPRATGLQEIDRALATNYARLSRSQRRVVDHLLHDTRYAAVVSGTELAKALGVSESTVTRAAQTLGFAGYPDLQAHLRQQFVNGIPERMATTAAELGDAPVAAAVRVMFEDAETIRRTAEDLVLDDLAEAVRAIVAAPRVFIFGSRGSFGLALMLGMGLRLLLPDVRVLNQTAGDLADQLISLDTTDVLIAASLRRVDRVTVDVLRYAHNLGATTIVITDHRASAITRLADIPLVARAAALRLTASYAAGASLVNALIVVTSLHVRDRASAQVENVERLWQEFSILEDALEHSPQATSAS
jgi:DNA-binding MurR/RpiR family transcriptional regulator